jgi:hypothetical protein
MKLVKMVCAGYSSRRRAYVHEGLLHALLSKSVSSRFCYSK